MIILSEKLVDNLGAFLFIICFWSGLSASSHLAPKYIEDSTIGLDGFHGM